MKYCSQCGLEFKPGNVDQEQRQRCDCGFVVWDNPIPVAAALVWLGDRVVLARNALWPGKIYSLITGYVEARESPEQCIRREVDEELGLQCVDTQFIGHYMFKEKNQLIIAYEVQAQGEICLSQELAETRLLSLAQLKGYDFSPLYITSAIVQDWLKLHQ